MAITSGFFKSVNGDRKYKAEFFASYFASFIGNGVFPNPSNNLQVIAYQNMQTIVSAGKAWINGYYLLNDEPLTITHSPADGVLTRIDRIVVGLNFDSRQMSVYLKVGTASGTPTPPTLTRNATVFELALADISIPPGNTAISQANITDQRLNNALCGIVQGTVNQVDTTTIFNQYQQALLEFETVQEADYLQWSNARRAEFEAWYNDLQVTLDGNVATNLTNRIITLENSNQKATQAEAQDGTNNTKNMSPLRVKQSITATFADPGFLNTRTLGANENIDNVITNGFYRMAGANFNIPNLPIGTYLVSVINASNLTVQRFSLVNVSPNRHFVRIRNTASNPVWSPIKEDVSEVLQDLTTTVKNSLVGAINEINASSLKFNNTRVNNAELNNYTTIGKYAIGLSPLVGGVVSNGYANCALEVSASADIIFQELKLLNGAIYQRLKLGGSPWSDILQVYDGQTNFYDLKQSVSNGKALVAAAVTGKGVPTAADATFQTIATNVSQINTGINYRVGTVTSNNTLVDFRNIDNTNIVTAHQVTISNIGFLPRSVKLFTINSVDNNWDVIEYDSTVLDGAIRSYSLINGSPISLINSNYAPVVVNANSIVFPVRLANTQYTYKIYGE